MITPTRMITAEKRRLLTGLGFISPWIIGFLVFTFYPIAASLYYSFCDYRVLSPPVWVGVANYVELVRDEYFWRSVLNTAFMFLELPLAVALGIGLAVLLNQAVKGLAFFRSVFYLPAIVPTVATAMLWLWIFNPDLGLANAALESLGLPALPWLVSPTTSKPSFIIMDLWGVGGGMIIYLAALQGVPEQLHEAAALDGANALQRFRHVTLPAISPVIFFMVITGMISLFQYFTQAFIMTDPRGGPEHSTLFYALYLFQNAFEYFKMGYACAMGWILFVVSVIATIIVFRTSARWVYYEEAR